VISYVGFFKGVGLVWGLEIKEVVHVQFF
jgi:hypothetical protein